MIAPNLMMDLRNDLEKVADLDLIDNSLEREKFSRDFFDYSPILLKQLEGCLADLVVRPYSSEAVLLVASACAKYGIPLTLRGSGTGNYGQCVPLDGGVVMIMNELSHVKEVDPSNGIVTVESGCLLRDLEKELFTYGRQLRLLPSTWRSASIGGFLAGGSGGIGSVRWGFLRDPGNLLGLEVVTVENPSRKLLLDAGNSEALNHAYGTNGIITSITMATAPAVVWHEVVIDCENWAKAVDFLKCCVCAAVDLHLCTLLEKDIVEKIPTWSGEYLGQHRLLILVAADGVSTLERLAQKFTASFKCLGPENSFSGIGLRELSWNHTTLHMRAVNNDWTYLQMLLPQPEIEILETLKIRWGEDLLWHLEAVFQHGSQRVAALPIVKWRGKESLYELINDCKKLGAILFNPHVITVEDGGLGVIDGAQVEAKRCFDPNGLLNPGKLKGWN